MDDLVAFAVIVAFNVLVGGVLLILPRIGRRGLLFGVYVGEAGSAGARAAEVRRAWDRTLVGAIAAAILVGLALALGPGIGLALPAAEAVLLGGFFFAYLRAHRQARELAAPVPAAAQTAEALPTVRLRPLPMLALAAALAGGLFAILYAASHYPELPDRIPIHFGPSGEPDGWAERSWAAILLMPTMTLVMGVILAGAALLVGRVRLAVRSGDQGVSRAAQERFRRALSDYLAVIGLLTTAALAVGSVSIVEVALGREAALHPTFLVLMIAMVVWALAGVVVIGLRVGQGGARLEEAAAGEPLTGGLADNRRWRLGLFYVNPDDPALFVEQRFGLGYTLNFGNRTAVVLLLAFLLFMVGLMVVVTAV